MERCFLWKASCCSFDVPVAFAWHWYGVRFT
jgi:hypothetical protein